MWKVFAQINMHDSKMVTQKKFFAQINVHDKSHGECDV
jgi:hypothetical protein